VVKGGNFKIRILADGLSADKTVQRFLSLQRSGQYSELRIVQKGRGSKYRITGYKWPSKSARRKLNIGKARWNPNAEKGPTDNQVLFGQRGKTKVGWIHRETPTRYEITYKSGPHSRTVWRKKNLVKFVKTGRRGKVPTKNVCPKTANTSKTAAVKKAVKISKEFFQFKPRKIKKVKFNSPKALTHLGECSQVNYINDKFDGKFREYFHEFENKPQLFAADRPQPNGSQMLLIIGKFKIKKEGITG